MNSFSTAFAVAPTQLGYLHWLVHSSKLFSNQHVGRYPSLIKMYIPKISYIILRELRSFSILLKKGVMVTILGMLTHMFKYNTPWVLRECYRNPSRVLKSKCYGYTHRLLQLHFKDANGKCTKQGIKDGVMTEIRIYCCTCGELQRLGRMLLLLQRFQWYSKITETLIKFEKTTTKCQLSLKIKKYKFKIICP